MSKNLEFDRRLETELDVIEYKRAKAMVILTSTDRRRMGDELNYWANCASAMHRKAVAKAQSSLYHAEEKRYGLNRAQQYSMIAQRHKF